jgi:hypothetical protein
VVQAVGGSSPLAHPYESLAAAGLRSYPAAMAKDLTRSQKTNRAYTLALAGTGSGIAAVVLLFVSGFGLFLLFAIIAVLCFLGFRRTVS